MKPTPISRPLIANPARAKFIASMVLASLVIIALWCTASCEFVAEGEGQIGDPDHHRPDRPGGELLPEHPPGSTTDDPGTEGDSSVGASADASTSSSETTDPNYTDESTGDPGTSDGSSSSTGDPSEYEPAHCDMTCPAGDALEPDEAQAGGTWRGCYCATACEADDDCAPLEHCEPFFARCTIACMGDADCMGIDPVPGAMACTLWWNAADDFSRFCAYWNEDAP